MRTKKVSAGKFLHTVLEILLTIFADPKSKPKHTGTLITSYVKSDSLWFMMNTYHCNSKCQASASRLARQACKAMILQRDIQCPEGWSENKG